MKEEWTILFDRYREGSLSASERTDFEQQLKSDADFKSEFESYQLLIAAISREGRAEIRSYIQRSMSSKAKPYRPSGSSGGGFNFRPILGALILGAIGFMILIFTDTVQVENEQINDLNESLHDYQDKLMEMIYQDTIYDTIYYYDTMYYMEEVVQPLGE